MLPLSATQILFSVREDPWVQPDNAFHYANVIKMLLLLDYMSVMIITALTLM